MPNFSTFSRCVPVVRSVTGKGAPVVIEMPSGATAGRCVPFPVVVLRSIVFQ